MILVISVWRLKGSKDVVVQGVFKHLDVHPELQVNIFVILDFQGGSELSNLLFLLLQLSLFLFKKDKVFVLKVGLSHKSDSNELFKILNSHVKFFHVLIVLITVNFPKLLQRRLNLMSRFTFPRLSARTGTLRLDVNLRWPTSFLRPRMTSLRAL